MNTDRIIERRERLVAICAALLAVEVTGDQHLAFRVRQKTFAYYLHDHHGDGLIGLCCKAAPGDLEFLLARDPVHYYKPAYLGPKGWVSLRLDLDELSWDEVTRLVTTAYRLVAPKKLAAQVGASQ